MSRSALPAVVVRSRLPLLVRWLRIAGFPARQEPTPDGVLPAPTTGGAYHRVLLEGPDGRVAPDHDADVLVPDGDWREQFAAVAGRAGVRLRDLRLHTRCPSCGETLAFFAREDLDRRLPEGLPDSARHLSVCDGCDRVSWPGEAAADHARQLRDVYLQYLFRCDACGAEGDAAPSKNLLRIEIHASPGPVEIPEEELHRDHALEIQALIDQIAAQDPQELQDGVAYHREKMLCGPCKGRLRSFLKELFGGDPA